MEKDKKFILWFDQVSIADVALVGGKNASLGEMYTTLVPKGIRIPNGFAITAHAYRFFYKIAVSMRGYSKAVGYANTFGHQSGVHFAKAGVFAPHERHVGNADLVKPENKFFIFFHFL